MNHSQDRVLLISNDADVRSICRVVSEQLATDVVVRAPSKAALRLLDTAEWSVVLLDARARAAVESPVVRLLEARQNAPALVLVGVNTAAEASLPRAAQFATGMLGEMFTPQELQDTIAQATLSRLVAQAVAQPDQAEYLVELTTRLLAETNAQRLWALLVAVALNAFGAERVSLFLAKRVAGAPDMVLARGLPEQVNSDHAGAVTRAAEQAMQQRRALVFDQQHALSQPHNGTSNAPYLHTLAMPLFTQTRAIGALVAESSTSGHTFPANAQRVLTHVASIAAHVLGTIQQRHEAEDAARIKAFLAYATDAALVFDAATETLVEMNYAAQQLTGYSTDQRALPLSTLFPAAEAGQAPVNAALSEQRAELQRRDGHVLSVLLTRDCVDLSETQYVFVTVRDLSIDQHRIQELVQFEKNTSMDRLVTSIAHEINNPLQALYSSLHLLVDRPLWLTDEKRELYLRKAQGEVDRLSEMVQRILEFYRSPRDHMRPISLHQVLEDTLAQTAPALASGRVELQHEWSGEALLVRGISHHLRQVFLSLVYNAIEAMPDGGTLTVRTKQHQERGRTFDVVEIVDTGPGIPPEHLHSLFEPFFTTKTNGTGLGLAVSYTIVNHHEGMLSVSSTAQGVTFRVTLPAA